MSELKMLTQLGHHENIVNLLGACTLSGNRLLPGTPVSAWRRKTSVLILIPLPQSHCGPPAPVELEHSKNQTDQCHLFYWDMSHNDNLLKNTNEPESIFCSI